jgi:hypothetical protein
MSSTIMRSLLSPILAVFTTIALVESVIEWRFHPSFWERTSLMMHDAYRGESFDRVELFERLSHFEDSDPDIISVGDSSGFFSLQSTIVNRYLDGAHFLSLNTGGNMAYEGYKGIAEYMLRRSKRLKYIVLYIFPQLVPAPEVIRVGDLGPIVYDALVGTKSRLTPPTAFLSPYAKAAIFRGDTYNADQLLQYQPSAVRLRLRLLEATLDDALGWLPEFDVRFDRINERIPFYSDQRTDLFARAGFYEHSSIYHVLEDFNAMAQKYGATLAIAFAPIPETVLFTADPNVIEADRALERFSHDHPEVKMLFPLLTLWSPEKFGNYNHISREYTFLSSERMGKALRRLLAQPDNIPTWQPISHAFGASPPAELRWVGNPDHELLKGALSFFIYNTTLDETYRNLISTRTLKSIKNSQSYNFMIEDARTRIASLNARQIEVGYDISELEARPIEVSGLNSCNSQPNTQWAEIRGTMLYTYNSPEFSFLDPRPWPEQSHIFIPTVLEDGVRKFDGYCPEAGLQ